MTDRRTADACAILPGMHRTLVATTLFAFALATLPSCGDDGHGDNVVQQDPTFFVEPTGHIRLDTGKTDGPTLLVGIADQLASVKDRASANKARLAIEVQMQLLRNKLPKVEDFRSAPEGSFAKAMPDQVVVANAIIAKADELSKNAEFEAILGPYLHSLRDLLK